jgi:hypothetical protein
MTTTSWPFPTIPGYFEAVRAHNATLDRLARDCASCSADYHAANEAFSEALRALPYTWEGTGHDAD